MLDEPSGPSLYKPIIYSQFLTPNERLNKSVKLFIITTTACLSAEDKEYCTAYAEIDHPSSNGALELIAAHWSKQFGAYDVIYTKQEDLIVRAAYLRELLGVKEGLKGEEAMMFRNKFQMKEWMRIDHRAGIEKVKVPPYARIFTPSCVLSFIKNHSLPVILKPILGSASAGVTTLHTNEDVDNYLKNAFYDRLESDSGKRIDYSGDIIAESYLTDAILQDTSEFQRARKVSMYHVNGYYASDSTKPDGLVRIWPFKYLQTNLGFTKGQSYGNVSILPTDAEYESLLKTTKNVLARLPRTQHLIFHLELFRVRITKSNKTSHKETIEEDDFYLCEIAARRPGGSIGSLIDQFEVQNGGFHRYEFRASVGLESGNDSRSAVEQTKRVGDLMVPYRIGKCISLPQTCPFSSNGVNSEPRLQYILVGKVGTVYKGFDILKMNTVARFVLTDESGRSLQEFEDRFRMAEEWFRSEAVYETDDDESNAKKQKPLLSDTISKEQELDNALAQLKLKV